MKFPALIALLFTIAGCVYQQPQKTPQFGNASVYTTPGTKGGVSYTKYEVTPL